MKFKFSDPDIPDFIDYFLIEGAAKLSALIGKDIKEIWPEMFNKDGEPQEWEMKFMLNGVELPALEVFKHMDSQFEDMVNKRAVKLIRERFNSIEDLLMSIEGLVIDRVKQDFPDFNEEEDY